MPLLDEVGGVLAPLLAPPREGWDAPGRLVVGVAGDVTQASPALDALAASLGGRLLRLDSRLDFAVVSVPPLSEASFTAAAMRVDGVAYVHRDAVARTMYAPNDTLYGHQWGAGAIGMPAAWNVTTGSHDRTVAVLDTGVGPHPDLTDNLCVMGPDYVQGDADPSDVHGHGTHVAGTVAARLDNGLGVAGMADACIMAVRVLDGGGSGYFSDIASGIVWSADNGADIVSMSLGGCPGCDPGSPVTEAVQYAAAADVLIVAAAGNAYCSPVSYPAAYPEVVAVGALAPPGDVVAGFSSCGDKVEVSAPGQDVISTALTSGPLSHPSGYMNLSGTSMATPHVAGVAALVWAHRPDLSASDVRCILSQTADDVMAAGKDPKTGWGRIDAPGALAGECVATVPAAPILAAQQGTDSSGAATAVLSWTKPSAFGAEVTSYNVYQSTEGSPFAFVANTSDQTTTVGPLAWGTTYAFAVSAVNSVGEGPASASVNVTPTLPQPLPFFEDFESGAPGWTGTGLWHLGADRAASPNTSYYYGIENGPGLLDNTYDTGATNAGDVVSPPIDLTNESAVTLRFWHHWEGEGGSWERPIVQVSTAGAGGPWTSILQRPAQTGEATEAVSLTPYVGGVVHLRFHWDTIDPIANDYEGWYVDDVQVVAGETAPNTQPNLAVTSPQSGQTVSGVFFATGNASDPDAGDAVEAVEVRIDGGFWNVASGTTNWSIGFDSAYFGDGAHTLYARAYDGEAYSSTWIVPFNIQNAQPNQPPSATIDEPAHNATVSGNVDVRGTFSDPEGGMLNLTLRVDGNLVSDIGASGNGSYVFGLDTTAYADGEHTLCVLAEDGWATGGTCILVNVANASNASPTVRIDAPLSGATVTGEVRVAGRASDPDAGDAVVLVQVRVDGGAWMDAGGASEWAFVWDTMGYANGAHVIEARASDGTAFSAAEAVQVEVRNNHAPNLTILAPAYGQEVGDLLVVNGEAGDVDGDAVAVSVRIDGGDWLPVSGSASWFRYVDTHQLANGLHDLEARASDGTLEVTRFVQFFVVNGAPPGVVIESPRDGALVGGVFEVTGWASGDAQRVEVWLGGYDDWVEATGTQAWSVKFDAASIPEGSFVPILARAFDGTEYAYTVTYVVANLHDLAIHEEDLVVVRAPLRTEAGDAPNVVNEERTIRVTVRNDGTWGADGKLWVVAWSSAPLMGSSVPEFLAQGVTVPFLAPGASATFAFPWDTTGYVGDVTIQAYVDAPWAQDHNPSNNVAYAETFVRAGGFDGVRLI